MDKLTEIQREHAGGSCVHFEGHEELEGFYGRVEAIYLTPDGEIAAVVRDLEGEHETLHEIPWEHLENCEFEAEV